MTSQHIPLRSDPLHQHDALLEVFANFGEGAAVFNGDCRLVSISARALELSGLTAEQAIPGMHLRDMFVLRAEAGEFGLCDAQLEADRRMTELRYAHPETYECTRSNGSVIAIKRSPLHGGGFLTIYIDITDRVRTKQELRTFKFTVDSITDMVSVVDLQQRYVMVNDAWCLATGLRREQVLGCRTTEVPIHLFNQELQDAFLRCLATRQPQLANVETLLSGQSLRNLETRCYAYAGEAGGLLGVVFVSRDVTEIRRSERLAREQERLISTVANSLPGMVGYWTRDLRCGFSNAQYQVWFGRSEEQMRGISMQELMGPELFAKNEVYIRAALRGEDQQFERTLVKANGETGYTWAQYIADRVDGEVRGFFVLVSDITPLKQSQFELERVNAAIRISAVAFEGQEGIMVMDDQRLVLQVNAAFTRITGFVAGDLLGKRAFPLRSSRYQDAVYEDIVSRVQATGSWEGELWCKHAAGYEFPASLTITAVADVQGALANYVLTFIDISDRYRRDEQRRQDEAVQRAALVREVHHRIKNNLQGITGLLRQFGQQHPETALVLNQAIGQIKSIATIHGLQGQDNKGRVSVGGLMRAIVAQVRDIWRVPVEMAESPSAADFFIVDEEAVPVAMILNEMLFNSVKHCDTNRPGVCVRLVQDALQRSASVRITNNVTSGLPVARDPLSGSGQQLMAHLMPSSGAQLNVEHMNDTMVVELLLNAPVLVLN
ncbi:MAG: PAS domain-containing protein [Rhodoferax sp.]|uniref:PAS domain-containing protein n=1 Tax=Rhodoferax sp. TaxID=50421 RepID=UPI0032652A07